MSTGISQSSTSTAQLAYLEETAFGVIPTGTPRKLRFTGESFAFDFTMSESEEINSTGQVTDAIITDASATGGFNFHWQYKEYDDFLEALLRSTFSSYGTGGVKSLSLTFNATAGTITGTAGDFTGLVAGQWFSVDGSDSNDGVYRISTLTTAQITVDDETPLLDDEGPTASVDISSTRLSIGTDTLRSFCIEKTFTDVEQYFMNRGRAISKMELNFAVGQILSGSFDTIGKDEVRDDATQFDASPDPSETFGVASSIVGVGTVLVRDSLGASILDGAYINSLTLTVDGMLREQKALSNQGAIGIGKGTFSIKATGEIYLVTGSIYDTALSNATVSLAIPVMDTNNNGYVYILDNVKLNVPKANAGAKDNDTMLNFEATAIAPNTATDSMIKIDRFGDSVADET